MEPENRLDGRARRASPGQTMTEYSLVVVFIGIAAYSAYTNLGLALKSVGNNLVTFINAVVAAL